MKTLSTIFGISSNATALYLNIGEWLFSIEVNKLLTLIISLLAIIWWLFKIYNQYLSAKNKKKNLKK